jgi:hypothetical protein
MNNRRKSPRLSAISTPITSHKLPKLVAVAGKNSSDKTKLSGSSNILKAKRLSKKSIHSKLISTRSSTRILSKQSKIINRTIDSTAEAFALKNSKFTSTSSRKRKIIDENKSFNSNIKKPKCSNVSRNTKINNKNSRKCGYKSRSVKFIKRNNKTNAIKNNHIGDIDSKKEDSSSINNNNNDKTSPTNSLLLANTSTTNINNNDISVNSSVSTNTDSSNTSLVNPSTSQPNNEINSSNHNISLNSLSVEELKNQLKKATIKFDKACRQLITLDQHMNDLQNSYSSSLENDRKTFKILYRMQLATLEGTHNAYIEYIERQVEKIKKIKRLLFNDNNVSTTNNDINNTNN